jgi:hypothetical protein
MQELDLMTTSVSLETNDSKDATEVMNQLLLVVPRLVNLKVLRVGHSYKGRAQFPDERSEFKKKLLKNHTKLEILSLRIKRRFHLAGNEFHEDEFVKQLVATNPNIREINSLVLTEAGIRSLSSLNNLMIITGMRVKSADQIVPSVMILLTGGSGHCLQKVQVGLWKERGAAVVHPFADGVIEEGMSSKLLEAGLPFKIETSADFMTVTRECESKE